MFNLQSVFAVASGFHSMGVSLQFVFVSWEITEVIVHTVKFFYIINLVFGRFGITCMIETTRERRKFRLFLCVRIRDIISVQVNGRFLCMLLFSQNGHNFLGGVLEEPWKPTSV